VDASLDLALKRVLNYPIPFSTETRFQFEHNRAGEPLAIDIQIFDQMGNIVKRIQENLVSTGNRVNQITWDGSSDSGSPLSGGMYVYRVIVKSTEDGSVATDYSKLVFVK
jgi:flagellar hook assembly protein FlgD